MKKVLGIFGLLVAVCVITGLIEPNFYNAINLENLVRRTSLFGIISVGVAFVIITRGIDLSIGSVIGLTGCLMPLLLINHGWPWPLVLLFVFAVSLVIGLAHGLLITKLQLQPFVVTLCGLLFYRGLGRWLANDRTMGFGAEYDDTLRQIAIAKIDLPGTAFNLPVSFLFLLVLTVGSIFFLHKTVWGRQIFAIGSNPEAARYCGVHVDRITTLAYIICAGMAGIAGILFALDTGSIQPAQHGNFYELYAIAAAVLGGCSLRGGEGSILGVVIGAAIMRVLYNSINLLEIPTQLEFAIIGAVILIGVGADETIRRYLRGRAAPGIVKQGTP